MSRTTSHQSSPMAGVYAVSDNKVVLVVGLGEVGKQEAVGDQGLEYRRRELHDEVVDVDFVHPVEALVEPFVDPDWTDHGSLSITSVPLIRMSKRTRLTGVDVRWRSMAVVSLTCIRDCSS